MRTSAQNVLFIIFFYVCARNTAYLSANVSVNLLTMMIKRGRFFSLSMSHLLTGALEFSSGKQSVYIAHLLAAAVVEQKTNEMCIICLHW